MIRIRFFDSKIALGTEAARRATYQQCRLQQLREGWFSSLEKVPIYAISMFIF